MNSTKLTRHNNRKRLETVGECGSDTARRSLRYIVVALATVASMILFSSARAQESVSDTPDEKPGHPAVEDITAQESAFDDADDPDEKPRRRTAKGILPQLGIILQLPEDYKLYDPEGPRPPDEYIEYDRTFPVWGEKLINRGYKLPLPFGV